MAETNLSHLVQRGDNLIKIARKYGLNSLDEILELNPEITNPNLIRVGQEIRLPGSVEARANLPGATVTAAAPNYDRTDFASLPQSVQQKVMAYSQAVKDGKMRFNDIPKLYQQQVYNQGIRNATNKAAPYVAKWVLAAPWSVADTAVRGTLNEGRKLVKRAVTGDKSEGDYGVQDYFGNFSWLGKDFQEEHPVADAAINFVTTPAVMVGGERLAAGAMDGTLGQSFRAAAQNARAGAQGTARAMGVGNESPLPAPREGAPVQRGAVYKAGSKGSGKTGTATRYTRGGYQANSSAKGRFSNEASYTPNGKLMTRTAPKDVTAPNPFVGTGYWHGLMMPLPEERRTNYVIKDPTPEETHIEETVPTNSWIYNTTYNGPRTPYRQGMERATYFTGEAPRGGSPKEQPITKESIQQGEGRVVRGASEQPGRVTGNTPSGMFSGYGFTYGPEGGALIYHP